MRRVDAVVVGAGPNGLVGANLLIDAGWDVLVLEAQPQIGGAVASDQSVRDGFVHDTFSSFYPLAAASPTIQRLHLEREGLEWVHAPAVVANPLDSGSWAVLRRDRDETAAGLDALHPGDGEAWQRLCGLWDRIGDDVIGSLVTPFPPVRHGTRLGLKVPGAGGLALLRRLLLPVRRLADESFGGDGPKLLLAGNAGHADIGMDSPGSGLMGLLLVMLGQQHGFPVPKGGAGRLAAALADRLRRLGGTIETGVRVDRVMIEDGRVTGVHTESGEAVEATRAVLADVSAPALYGGLVSWDQLPTRLRRRMQSFAWDPSTVKVDWALKGPIPWDPGPDVAPGTIHLADSVRELALAGSDVSSGVVPRRALILLGQMATTDPGRAPAGCESAWGYTHVPQQIRADAGAGAGPGGAEIRGPWTSSAAEQIADRMESRIVEHAPTFRDLILDRRVLGPVELQARDENLVGGAINGGTAELQQQLIWRPTSGGGRAETPVKGLYLASASAHPGGGVHGACGANAARAALAHHRVREAGTAIGSLVTRGRLP